MRRYGSLCVLIGLCVSLWFLINFDASICVVMCPYGSLYSMSSCMFMDFSGSLWVLICPYQSLIIFMDSNVSLWVFIVPCLFL